MAIEAVAGLTPRQTAPATAGAPTGITPPMKPTPKRRSYSTIRVRPRPGERTQGWLTADSLRVLVALGRGGIKANKREGDGATPRGCFRLVRLWWRPDRGPRPRALLPLRPIATADAWCEAPSDRRYNRPIQLTRDQPGDRLWRDDSLYDLVVELDHNARPRIAGRGSAVFIHVARPGLRPTAGCIAVPRAHLRRLVERCGRNTRISIY